MYHLPFKCRFCGFNILGVIPPFLFPEDQKMPCLNRVKEVSVEPIYLPLSIAQVRKGGLH